MEQPGLSPGLGLGHIARQFTVVILIKPQADDTADAFLFHRHAADRVGQRHRLLVVRDAISCFNRHNRRQGGPARSSARG